MDTLTIFLIFGIGLACYAVIMAFTGLRFKKFPNGAAMAGFLGLGLVLVACTIIFVNKLQIQEAHEREESQKTSGQSASVVPVRIPANF